MSDNKSNGQAEFLSVRASDVLGFIQAYRKEYFEDHSTEWCLDEIISRGKAEIKRQVKTAVKTAENRAAGDLLRMANLTPKQAQELLVKLAAQAKAEAAKPSEAQPAKA